MLPDVARLIEWGYWFDGDAGPPTPYTYVVVAIFTLVFVLGLVVWQRRRQLFPGHRIKTRLAARFGPWVVGLSVTGLISALMRVAGGPILSARIIWLAMGLAILGIVLYVGYYLRVRAPAEMARYQREEALRRVMPRPRRERRGGHRRR